MVTGGPTAGQASNSVRPNQTLILGEMKTMHRLNEQTVLSTIEDSLLHKHDRLNQLCTSTVIIVSSVTADTPPVQEVC